ncbi:MAG: hypothetical protein A3I73_02655 [Omnitrophica bacterium RIFCSPLOWO2_02_FULL_45_16]|nr:MAG: hypothetical protein A3C51_01225 [Omnitrophica bacterium RIFCSPHIGHO2_02_FULL_46_20]OGW93419.1 MAG: hypothetical protein A3K16_06190 [Omnitrophica bacterium RIFCSPLOWO2_01_FULL_45_24]OGW93583.1 MAG: hypothetical protein A3G36_00730 [Omnitrophica bacterium RIFCSPLOWO2_12_FULL_45_13]OGX01406.1 MAG: hypothetical protein A3I73_02655 [Omnitrophica bacterium RIFCSPLOWO2_02_FULL_45_16]
MKTKERKLARVLRSQGLSLRAISAEVKCSKSTISRWISDIELTDAQIIQLKSNQDKGRAKAAKHPNSSRQKWERIRSAIRLGSKKEIPRKYSNELLKMIGAALYWAEGYKASRNEIIFANTDPSMIRLIMLFFRKICKVPESKFRGKVFIHPHLDVKQAEKYWSRISMIALKQFNKPLLAISRASKRKRDTLPMGTFSIVIGDVYTCSKIKGWIEGLSSWV